MKDSEGKNENQSRKNNYLNESKGRVKDKRKKSEEGRRYFLSG